MFSKTPLPRVLFGRCRKPVGLLVLGVFLFTMVLTAVGTLTSPLPAQAATNNQLNFQARLQTNTGGIVPDGYYNVQFNLYAASSGGTTLWTESHIDTNGVTAGNDFRIRVKNGYLTVSLGSQNPFPSTINWDQDLWLTMNIGGTTQTATPTYDGEMNPRLKLTGVPYAFRAGQLATGNGTLQSTLQILQPTVGNQIFQIQDQAAAGTYNLCIQNSTSCGFAAASGSANYIQNTTSPQASSNFNISGNGTIGGNLNVTGNANLIKPGTNSVTAFQIQPSGSTTPVLNVDTTNSRVGIGTAAPGAKLDVVGQIRTSGSAGEIQLQANDGSGNFYTLYSATGELSFYGGLNVRAVLTAGGNFGVGLNANPQYPLDVTGAINTSTQYRIGGNVQMTSSALTFTAASASSVQSATGQSLTIDSGTTGALNLGTGANAKTITIGNATGATSIVLNTGTGGISIGANGIANTLQLGNTTGAVAQTINVGNNATASSTTTVNLGSTIGTSTTNIRAGSGGISILGATNINTSGSSATNIGTGTTSGNVTIGNQTTGNNLILQAANITLDAGSGTGGNLSGIGDLGINGNINQGGTNRTFTSGTGAASFRSSTFALGDATTDRLTITSQIQGGSPMVFQGATDNSFTTTLALTDPTANNTITLPNASGTVAVSATGNIALSAAGQISLTGTVGVGNGGTGATSYTTNGVLYYNGTNFASTAAGTSGECLKSNGSGSAPTYGACGTGSASTLQDAYNASGSTNPQIQLSGANGGFKIRDNATPISGNLFQLQNSGGTATFFGVSASAATLQDSSGNDAMVFDSTTSRLRIYENTTSPTRYLELYYDTAANEAVIAASSGTTRVGSGSGNISLALSNAADVLVATKTLTLGAAYSANDFSFTRTITAGANSLTGSVVSIESLSTGTSNASTLLRINENNNSATGNLIVATKGGAGNDKFKVDTGGTVTIAAGQSYTSAGAVTYTGAGAVTVSSAASTALTLTGNAASTFSTTAGALTLTGAAGVNITGGSGNVTIGTSDTTGTLLVLDTKTNAGDPTGVDGGMYYNSSTGKFRCYEASVWRNCVFPEAIVTKSANQNATASSTTFQNVTDLVVALDANSRYTFQATIPVDVSNITADAKVTFTVPAGATITASGVTPLTATTNTICNIVTSGQTCAIAVGAAFRSSVTIHGFVSTAGTSGDLQFQFAQNTSTAASAPTVLQGGIIKYIKQ